MGKERLKGFTSEITDDLYGEAQKVKSKNLHEKVQHVTSQADLPKEKVRASLI